MNTPSPQGNTSADGPAVSRRGVVAGVAGAAVMFGLGAVRLAPQGNIVRPPGGQDALLTTSSCLHCEKCREVCPQGAIGPAHLEDGLLSMRTPKMHFRKGWCDFCADVEGGPRCIACCPSHALRASTDGSYVLGCAQLTREWCLGYRGMLCHSCVNACPYGALSLDEDNVPVVDEAKCNGCGACENACISMSAGSISGTWDASEMTDRAITVRAKGAM